MDVQAVSHDFVQDYNNKFNNPDARSSMDSLYHPESMLIWDGIQHQGTHEIISALTGPNMRTVKTHITSVDATPSANHGVLVVVTGNLTVSDMSQIDDGPGKPLTYSATFSLQPIPELKGGFFIHSQIFRAVRS
ncbi:hypothetical protein E8E15_010571 [Penicillium rubens]|uniref:NTF2-related export protein n=2 Tax=Penicillium chrysogenum species complex TaxID=254878 RepID=B6HRS1_PENRW|nr:uncharacterized protein N7525_005849 [Penicillium rubens]KZN85948.1 Nuclear transport factor [Penicillium chrysogenum]CAP97653.1 Pc22g03650 [Penicillium rubens Wisconsin 54-1255]KAF3029948.1 hypothetical protein E8E15_010571 [Penicillium rubens]KAJ5840661.1 hypothetical protein N7525_005849 [Penicillium rubens]KAJ5868640.1 hypothetical protein N7534_003193 [Penicillium rubens]